MKSLREHLNESLKGPIFNEESKIRMAGGREKETIFTIDGQPILGYAQGNEKDMMELVNDAARKDKIYHLTYRFGVWEGVIISYYTNAYGRDQATELMGSSSNDAGITAEKIKAWAADTNNVLVKIS